MKKIQSSATGKLLAVAVLLCAVFAGAVFGLQAYQAISYVRYETYRESAQYRQLLLEKGREVQRMYYLEKRLDGETDFVTLRTLEGDLQTLRTSLEAENTNFRYKIWNQDGAMVASNLIQSEDLGAGARLETFYVSDSGYGYIDLEAPVQLQGEYRIYTLEFDTLPEEQMGEAGVLDEFYQCMAAFFRANNNFTLWLTLGFFWLAVSALCLLYILWSSGHQNGSGEIVLTWQEKIWSELYLLVAAPAAAAAFGGGLFLLDRLSYYAYNHGLVQSWETTDETMYMLRLGISTLCVVFAGLVTLILRTLAVRLKARALARTTLLCRVVGWMIRIIHDFLWNLPITWKVVVCFLSYWAVILICVAFRLTITLPVLILFTCAFMVYLCWWTVCFRRLREGSRSISAGNLNHQIDTTRMPHDLKAHGEDLNNITNGLQTAVNEQMKSERFKAELITNVSHDLKTPLTSIINYVDLLKTTRQADPKAEEYIEVLDRKAQRLKKLTEDLVEASKASTGTLSVSREKIGMGQLIDQALGEYKEKLEDRNLTVVTTLPEDETYVYADGRHLWRVIDNLLSNCCKYAMEGTRVYIELFRGKGQVMLAVKNISREPLTVPAERLMERFVRGDESRTTEGSGLGLSIARSLTELQGGTFQLAVDGDLFKAIVTIPQAG